MFNRKRLYKFITQAPFQENLDIFVDPSMDTVAVHTHQRSPIWNCFESVMEIKQNRINLSTCIYARGKVFDFEG